MQKESKQSRLNNLSERRKRHRRSLGGVLLRRTLSITLFLGLAATAFTMWLDPQREKDAVERLVRDFVSSVTPSAEAVAYNFDDVAASQVAKGLFLGRAITRVVIVTDGDVMVDETRDTIPTLPQMGMIGTADEVELRQVLREPVDSEEGNPIGELLVTLDRSLVAPEFVD